MHGSGDILQQQLRAEDPDDAPADTRARMWPATRPAGSGAARWPPTQGRLSRKPTTIAFLSVGPVVPRQLTGENRADAGSDAHQTKTSSPQADAAAFADGEDLLRDGDHDDLEAGGKAKRVERFLGGDKEDVRMSVQILQTVDVTGARPAAMVFLR